MLFSEGKDEDQTMIAYKESDVLENLEEDEESGFPQPPKVGCENWGSISLEVAALVFPLVEVLLSSI